ncbi:MAG: VWA domain-containing protein [bacterium]|nr:VWA domain-containing protein [bacterium]
MSFLSPAIIGIVAAVTIPPLVALYFLKLRRQERAISSTLLWQRAVQDLHVNSPFQRLRNNLLLLLQLLVLLLVAFALGKPMWERSLSHESTLVLLIDQSASMAVEEEDGRTRLESAKQQAKRLVEGMPDDGRAMVIAFCDRATVVSSFDTDREDLKRKIDSIEQTQSSSTLTEAVALAEAYSQQLIIAGSQPGADVGLPGDVAAPPATAVIFTDGQIADAGELTIQRLDVENIEVVNIGQRADNVGIVAMSARRNYEQPNLLEVFATVRNFGPTAIPVDVDLRIRDRQGLSTHLGSGSKVLAPGAAPTQPDENADEEQEGGQPVDPSVAGGGEGPTDSVYSVAFKREWEGGGVVEIALTVEDALSADNQAWTVIPPPRDVRVLAVTPGNLFLERVLATLPMQVSVMSPAEYEEADPEVLADGDRGLYDVVILDRHSTARLPQGSYFFWGAVPEIPGVSLGRRIDDEVIFNWDESHAILRHVPVETIRIWEWYELTVPTDVTLLMEGESSPVLCSFARDGRDYLISAFPLVIEDQATGQALMNTTWVTKAHYPVFVYNAIQYLSANLAGAGQRSVRPGEPIAIPLTEGLRRLSVRRPDGERDNMPTGGASLANYARTRLVGVYRADGAADGNDTFAVNLFSPLESDTSPNRTLTLGTNQVASIDQVESVNRPFWPWLLGAVLFVVLLEWVVYNKRVFV